MCCLLLLLLQHLLVPVVIGVHSLRELNGGAWGCPVGAVGVVEMGGGVVAGGWLG